MKNKKIFAIIILTLFVISMISITSAETPSRNVGISLCMPGYGGEDCVYDDCYGWQNPVLGTTYEECMAVICQGESGYEFINKECLANICIEDMSNFYETEEACKNNNAKSFVLNSTQKAFLNNDLSNEQIVSFSEEILQKVEDGSTIEEALEELQQEREQIRVQMQEQMQGSLKDDEKVANSFERKNNYSLQNVNATIYSLKDTPSNEIENMKQVAETFQERNMFQYNTFELIPIDVDNTLIVIERKEQFLFFNVEIKDKYIVDNFATVIEQKRSFWSYMVGR